MTQRYNTLNDTLPPILAPQYQRINQDWNHTGLKVLHVLSAPPVVQAGPSSAPPNSLQMLELEGCIECRKDITQNAAIIVCLANIFVDRAFHLDNQRKILESKTGDLEEIAREQIVCWGNALIHTNLAELSSEVERLLDIVGTEALSDVTLPTTIIAKQAFSFFNLAKRRMQEERDLFVQQLMVMFSLGFEGPPDLEDKGWSALQFLERAVNAPFEPKENEKQLLEWMNDIGKAYQEALYIIWDTSNSNLWCLTFYHKPITIFSK